MSANVVPECPLIREKCIGESCEFFAAFGKQCLFYGVLECLIDIRKLLTDIKMHTL